MEAWSAYTQGEDEFVGPPLLHVETVSVIRRLSFRNLLSPDEASQLVRAFLDIDVSTSTPPGLYSRAYDLAVQFRQSRIYDSCYLALAESLSCELLTLDRRLYDAVVADLPWVRLVG